MFPESFDRPAPAHREKDRFVQGSVAQTPPGACELPSRACARLVSKSRPSCSMSYLAMPP